MTYEETLTLIYSIAWRGSKPGLSRTRELLMRLGNPDKKLKFVHVAGTNGKGSTAAMIASILEKSGFRVGLYTSPFIYCFNERMQVNGEMISNEELAELTERIWPEAEDMDDPPTEFEIITALAMEYFLRHACDIVVLEAGLGGELDSTNVIDVSEVAVITSIGIDHTEELGNTYSEIASAKAGIIKEGGDVVFYGKNPEAGEVIKNVCREKHASLIIPDYSTLIPQSHGLDGQVFDYDGLQNLQISLLGLYQLNNAAVAVESVRLLSRKGWNITEDSIREGLRSTRWGGRLELLSEHPAVVVDGSHNPDGVAATVESLASCFGNHKIIFMMGVMADKDITSMISLLTPQACEFITVTPECPGRALSAKDLAEKIKNLCDIPVTDASSMEEGCELALVHAGRSGIVCAIGSMYLVGDITRKLKAEGCIANL